MNEQINSLSVGQEENAARIIADVLIEGFDKHYRVFQNLTRQAKGWFERRDWAASQTAVRERIRFYDDRVKECVARLQGEQNAENLSSSCWQRAKLHYIGKLVSHKQPELAETFFNSVTCNILHRDYFNNDFIFVRPAASTEYLESQPSVYRSYFSHNQSMRQIVKRICEDFAWQCSFENLERDIDYVLRSVAEFLGPLPMMEANFQIRVLHSPFYRNKAAYIIGKVINGYQEFPLTVPILHTSSGELYLDTILLEPWRISSLFSLSRAYFMVDMEVPSGYVDFLHNIMPIKSRSELYTMIGLGKQGKTMFYRDMIHHLRHSDDKFVMAPGIPGLVMLVFTLPSYAYVFKIIKDVFGVSKEMDRATVIAKYQMVKQHDRVGRMADSLEFSNVAFPRDRFDPQLLEALRNLAPSMLEERKDTLIVHHLYIERRMVPLNIYLEKVGDVQLEETVREYGNAIKEMAQTNIFPGDMLWKNFGVTRFGRAVFYDYDEIDYLTNCNFRKIPPAPDYESEMSGEVWYSVGKNDVFPEEFANFLLGNEKVRQAFMKYHADLLDADYWKSVQEKVRSGHIEDFFPYPERVRFKKRYAQDVANITSSSVKL